MTDYSTPTPPADPPSTLPYSHFLQALTHDEACFDNEEDVDPFDSMDHPKITFVQDEEEGHWLVRIDTPGPGYLGHTYWALMEHRVPTPDADDFHDALLGMLALAEERDRG